MRILTLTSSYPKYPGDTTAPFIEEMSRALVERGHELAVVLPARPDLRPRSVPGITFHPYRYAPFARLALFGYAESLLADVAIRRAVYLVAPLALLAGAAKLRTLARRASFDLVHAHWVVPNGAMALSVPLPLVVSLHGSDVFLAAKKPVLRKVARAVFRRAAAVTACSEDLRKRGLTLGAPESTLTLPYGVDAERFRPRPDSDPGEDKPIVLAVGRLVHKKGFQVLIDAMPAVLAAHPEAELVIAGRGDLEPSLRERAQSLGVGSRLRLLGNVGREELPAWYARATVVAVPSVHDGAGNVDGLPNVLLEAMASGAAIVASEVAGIPQAARHEQEALLVPERDPEALARALVRLLGSAELRDRLGRCARARVEASFDWKKTGERLEELFRSVARARG